VEKSEKILPNRLSSAGGAELGKDSSRSFRIFVFLFVNDCCSGADSGLLVFVGGDGGDGDVEGVGGDGGVLEKVLSCWFFRFITRRDILLETGSGSGSGIGRLYGWGSVQLLNGSGSGSGSAIGTEYLGRKLPYLLAAPHPHL